MRVSKTEHVQLTAPGNGETVQVGSVQPASAEIEVTVATIDTNVVVRMDLSDDNFSTTVAGEEKTITADGTFAFPVPCDYVQARPVFVSESGGTGATLDIVTKLKY